MVFICLSSGFYRREDQDVFNSGSLRLADIVASYSLNDGDMHILSWWLVNRHCIPHVDHSITVLSFEAPF
jgi:hypothetical protein